MRPRFRPPLAAVTLALSFAVPAFATPFDYLTVGDPLEAELRILDVLGPESASAHSPRHSFLRPWQRIELDSLLAPARTDAARALARRRLARALARETSSRASGFEALGPRETTPRLFQAQPAPGAEVDLSAGFEGRGELHGDTAFVARATGLHVRTAVRVDRLLAYAHVVAGEFAGSRRYADPIVSESDVTTLTDEAYLAYTGANGRWAVQFGRSRWHWGPGDEASLLLSGTSPAFTGALLRASVPELSLDFAALNATLAATAGEQLAAHRVEWQPLDALRLGLGEAARYHADGWRPTYAVGVIPYVLAQRLEASDEPDSGAALRNNVEVAVDAAWRVAPGTRVYGELLVDDLHSKTANVPDKLGYQIGLEGAGLALGRRLAWGAEYTRLSRFVYTSFFGRAFVARGEPLGFPTGPDSRRLRVRVSADVGGDWQLVARSALTDRGDSSLDEPFVPGDPRPKPFAFAGVVERTRAFEAGARWWPASGVDLALFAGFTNVENAAHVPGDDDTRFHAALEIRLER